LGAALVHVSSEQVFDGERSTAYATGDATSPINVYGRQKVASEHAVLEAASKLAAVVRAPLLMGDSPGGRRSLHERLLGDWTAGRTARLYVDEFRQPCTAANLADAMLELAQRSELRGVFHWAGAELISRYELGLRVREHFKLNEVNAPIVGIRRADTPEATRQRQACLALDLAPLAHELKARPQTIAEQLATLDEPAPVRAWLASR
jgi:dTDP-4-dehydrorhamnose reductase